MFFVSIRIPPISRGYNIDWKKETWSEFEIRPIGASVPLQTPVPRSWVGYGNWNPGCAYSHKLNVDAIFVPKAGSTSWRKVIWHFEGATSDRRKYMKVLHHDCKKSRCEKRLVFSTVREPIPRFQSAVDEVLTRAKLMAEWPAFFEHIGPGCSMLVEDNNWASPATIGEARRESAALKCVTQATDLLAQILYAQLHGNMTQDHWFKDTPLLPHFMPQYLSHSKIQNVSDVATVIAPQELAFVAHLKDSSRIWCKLCEAATLRGKNKTISRSQAQGTCCKLYSTANQRDALTDGIDQPLTMNSHNGMALLLELNEPHRRIPLSMQTQLLLCEVYRYDFEYLGFSLPEACRADRALPALPSARVLGI